MRLPLESIQNSSTSPLVRLMNVMSVSAPVLTLARSSSGGFFTRGEGFGRSADR